MRKLIAVILLLTFWGVPSLARAQEMDEALFVSAKEALTLISYGEYQKALKKLGLSSDAKAVGALAAFAADHLSELEWLTPQTDVAVGYRTDGGHKLVIPLETPSSGRVTAFALLSRDGLSFAGYGSMLWGDALKEQETSPSVVWNQVYDPGIPVLVPDG